MELLATCAAGLERLLADELRSLGCARVRPLRGQVAWHDTLGTGLRACLWSRLASRVMVVLARVDATGSDILYEGVHGLAWEDHLAEGATLCVDARGTGPGLRSSHFVALRTKDAIADRLLARRGARPQVDTGRPDLRVVVRVSRGRATVGIDLAGEPLFRRHRMPDATVPRPVRPLRPDLAAALLAAGDWKGRRHGLLALFPGTGAVVVEAAAVAEDRAPGLLRERWGFEGWLGGDSGAWAELLAEADGRAEEGARADPRLVAHDTRPGCRAATERALRASGSHAAVRFVEQGALESQGGVGLVACDLSWTDGDAPADRAAALGALSLAAAGGTPLVSLANCPEANFAAGREPREETRTMVGRDEATMRAYDATEPRTAGTVMVKGMRLPVLVPTSDQFAARLGKVARHRARWARRAGVSCYRVYDADLPDYQFSIDLFEGSATPGRWLQLYEYAPPREVDRALARARALDVVAIAARVLGVAPADVRLRVRRRARGGAQYADEAIEGRAGRAPRTGGETLLPAGAHLVDEGGLTFEVNFDARLDCGLFLDHRLTRHWLRELARDLGPGGRFLNLFAYTGTATCYAADGGCTDTTTVDLSRTSLEWARRNLSRNGFAGDGHRLVRADALAWVRERRRARDRWDLVFCDVPTFSNSRGMGRRSFDVQRDHVELLADVSRLLSPGGLCLFSCNLRTFRPDLEGLARAGVRVEDVTARTIPADFARTPRVHSCLLVSRDA